MDARAPAVVAVVVAREPGAWFDETLEALGRQDYEELSFLVFVSDDGPATTRRIARHLPEAFVRRLESPGGFGQAVNQALEMVEGAAFFLLCHDDCAPDPDALHLMVEESYRSNAGVVCPKMVDWHAPEVLVHVGMSADKTGAVVERIQAGELDAGQHDAVRDVFVAPGGCTLVRADLFRELGGYDALIGAFGEDLDLSWRAQVAGSRVIVAPAARARHLEALASGRRSPPPEPGGASGAGGADGADGEGPSPRALQRRHELRAVLKCYSLVSLVLVLPQVLLLSLGEVLVSLAVGDRERIGAVLGAWRWNFRHRGDLRVRRAALRAARVLPDREVRQLQLPGSARLSTYVSRLVYQGLDVAHARVPSLEAFSGAPAGLEPELTGSVGLAFSEDADFDELDDLGHRSGLDRFGRRRRRPLLTSHRSRLAVWIVAAVVLLVGVRNVLFRPLPVVGQYVPFLNWTSTWAHFFAGWQSPGVGSSTPSSPAFAVLGAAGTVLFGSMGLLQNLVVLGCIPIGAWGLSRLLRPITSPRARLFGTLAYLGLPLAYDALAEGRWDGLVAYAALPWILGRLLRLSGPEPAAARGGAEPRAWWQPILGLGALEALAVAFAPAVGVVVVLAGLALTVGSALVGQWSGALRALWSALAATLVAAVLLLPWVLGTLAAGRGLLSVLGLRQGAAGAPSWAALVHFDVGPLSLAGLSWLLVGAAVLPLLIGRRERLLWAGRLWVLAAFAWILALAVSRGWLGSFAPSVDVVLAGAAVGVAASVGLGVAAFESDLGGLHFGWRQVAAMAAVAASLVGMLPLVAGAANGRFDVPSTGYDQPLSFLRPRPALGAYRVLWLADPRALPGGGWSVAPGLAYATSEAGLPTASDLWAPASPGPAAALARSVELAARGETVDLGRLLAPAAVRYVVVVHSLAPLEGGQASPSFPLPSGLLASLQAQSDLLVVPSGGEGFTVYENTVALPERAQRARPLPTAPGTGGSSVLPAARDVAGWRPALGPASGGASYGGVLGPGTLFASYAPAGSWALTVDGRSAARRPAWGWAAQFRVVTGGSAVLSFQGAPLVTLGQVLEVLLWVVLAGALLIERRRRPKEGRRTRGGRRARTRSGRVGRAEALVPAEPGGSGAASGATPTPAVGR